MDFAFTEEQSMLREALAGWLADNYRGWSPEFWRAMAQDLGILGAPFAEDIGGLGGGAVENLVILEELGRVLAAEPYLSTVVIGGGFLKHSGHPRAADLIGRIVAGDALISFAQAEPTSRYNLADISTTARQAGAGWTLTGHKAVVIGAPYATHFIVTARTGGGRLDAEGVSIFLVERGAAGITLQDYPTVDGRLAAEVLFEDTPAEPIGPVGQGLPLLEKVIDEALAATCAEGLGVLRRLHEGTLAYVKERKQFGQPIGSFQALQHRLVDMYMALEQAVSLTYMATLKLDHPNERRRACAAAKVQVGQACRFVGQNAIQLHGGMGMTDEMAISHYFKRASLIEAAFGSTDHHLARYEAMTLSG
jgi:alkylation response protein AidB-like acyl-CoA dehydrogenase